MVSSGGDSVFRGWNSFCVGRVVASGLNPG